MTAVQVSIAANIRCPRCAAKLCLTANIGAAAANRTVALCPACDADNPDARRLLDYFAAHGMVAPQDRSHVSELLGRWLGSLTDREPSRTDLAAQAEAWWTSRKGQTCP